LSSEYSAASTPPDDRLIGLTRPSEQRGCRCWRPSLRALYARLAMRAVSLFDGRIVEETDSSAA
jgi:hypothetical protein